MNLRIDEDIYSASLSFHSIRFLDWDLGIQLFSTIFGSIAKAAVWNLKMIIIDPNNTSTVSSQHLF